MGVRKSLILFVLAVFLISFTSATDLEVSSQKVVGSIINEGDKPAVFDIRVENKEASKSFEIYTFERFEITPKQFSLDNGERRTIRVELVPVDSMKKNVGYRSVPVYFQAMSDSDFVREDLTIKLVDFDEAFEVKGESINPESSFLDLSVYNLEEISYEGVDIAFSADFINDANASFDFNPYEKKSVRIELDEEVLKKKVFGEHPIEVSYNYDDMSGSVVGYARILENSELTTINENNGIIVHKRVVEKINAGNVPTVAVVNVDKNIISRLFSTFSPEPLRVERQGFNFKYTWQEELQPDESLKVVVTTNWLFPLILLIAMGIIVYLLNMFFSNDVVLNKKVSYVKTKSGDFALKVSLRVRARKFVENVRIYDKLPGMTKLYEKYGQAPKHIDKNLGRMYWDLPHLAEGEERFFSYVIYSKLKVVGKFELPVATAVYEKEGKVHESKSNRAIFINEPKEVTREFD